MEGHSFRLDNLYLPRYVFCKLDSLGKGDGGYINYSMVQGTLKNSLPKFRSCITHNTTLCVALPQGLLLSLKSSDRYTYAQKYFDLNE